MAGMNGYATAGTEKRHHEPRPATAPAAKEEVPHGVSEPSSASSSEEPVVQEGEVIPASHPEPVSFITAHEGLNTLSLNEKSEPLLNAEITGPHSTLTANLLDPKVNPVSEEVPIEDAHTHHAANNKSDPAIGGGVEAADKAHAGGEAGVLEKLQENVKVEV
jgi:hypothetical protein